MKKQIVPRVKRVKGCGKNEYTRLACHLTRIQKRIERLTASLQTRVSKWITRKPDCALRANPAYPETFGTAMLNFYFSLKP